MQTGIQSSVKTYLDAYVAEFDKQLPDAMSAFYVHGSVALEAYQPEFSDIDFITVLDHFATDADIAALVDIHHTLKQHYPEANFSGTYLQADDLGRFDDTVNAHPSYHDGVLNPCGYHDINPVTWWILKHHGICLRGTPPQELGFSVDWDQLLADMHNNLNSYWRRFIVDPMRMMWLLSDWGIQWVILGVLRQYYSFREGEIVSKVGAGEYALAHLPQRWHRLIQEALHIRNNTGVHLYRSQVMRALEAGAFLKMIIRECNEIYYSQ